MPSILKKFFAQTYLVISLILLLLSTVLLNNYIDSKRLIPYEPDDSYHYLSKAVFLDKCKTDKCFLTNLFSKKQEKIAKENNLNIDRQIHRLTQSYHPLYTTILKYFLYEDKDVFKQKKKLDSLLGFLIFLSIFLYVIFFFKNSKLIALIFTILATHLYQGGIGIQFPVPFTLSIFLSALSLNFLGKQKIIPAILFVISCLLHKIGILISCISFLTFFFNGYFTNKISLINYIKKEIFIITLFCLIIISCFFVKFNIVQNNSTNLINLYNFDYNIVSSLYTIWDNLKSFVLLSAKTILFLNPIFFYFFLLGLRKSQNEKINIIKIFTLLLIIFFIFFPYGLKFALGIRSWPLFVCNYLIIGFFGLSYFTSSQRDKLIKKIYIYSIPFFILINIFLLYNYSLYKIYNKNSYYDFKLISKLEGNSKGFETFFNSSEETFYSYLLSGYVNKNFYFKLPNELNKSSFIVIDNPINFSGSSININENIDLFLDQQPVSIILLSEREQQIKVNEKLYNLIEGENFIKNIQIKKSIKKSDNYEINFKNINYDTKLIGIVLDDFQNTYWPWNKNLNLEITNDVFKVKRPFIFSRVKKIKKLFNFQDIKSNIFSEINSKCLKNIVYDKDSSLVIFNNCSKKANSSQDIDIES